MKLRSFFVLLAITMSIILSYGCDSVDEALVWKERHDALKVKYDEFRTNFEDLNVKYIDLELRYKQAQKEIDHLKLNSTQYVENTKIMLRSD